MLILIHVILAFSGILSSGLVFFMPSQSKLNTSYGLVAGTFISGTILVVSTKSGLISACVSGLVYLAAVSFGIIGARHKLASQEI